MKWINVKDQLPKKGEIVLVAGYTDGEKYVHWAEYFAYGGYTNKNKPFSIPGWTMEDVRYWMPLPDYPDEDK